MAELPESVPDDLSGASRLLAEFALASMLTPVLLVDGGGFIEGASPAALADLDRPPDAVRGQPVEAVLGFDPIDELGGDVHTTTTLHAPTLHQSSTARGTYRWRAVSLAGIRSDGGWILEFQAADLRDVPAAGLLDRRVERLDDLLVDLSERFENLNRYVGLISHDLQAPTRRLLSFVDLLRGDVDDAIASESRDQVRSGLDAIERSARHLLRLTTELLQYARLGSQPMPLQIVDAQAVLDGVLEQLDQQIAESDAVIEVTGSLPPVIAAPTFLGVVFQNLLQNGLKYRGEAPPRITVATATDEQGVRIEVRDNGIGIAPELRSAVFQPFRRLGPGDLEHSGLGLATVRDIVERFGGTISVTAGAVGEGSTFTLILRPAPADPLNPDDVRGSDHEAG